jgi:hypothetical protein
VVVGWEELGDREAYGLVDVWVWLEEEMSDWMGCYGLYVSFVVERAT